MRPHATNPFRLNPQLIDIRQTNVPTGLLAHSPTSQLLQGGAQAGIGSRNVARQAPSLLGQSPTSQHLQGGAHTGIGLRNVALQAPGLPERYPTSQLLQGGAQAGFGLRRQQAPDPRMQMDKIYRQNLLYMLRLQQRFQYNYRKQQNTIERARLDLKEQQKRRVEHSTMTMGEWFHAQNVGLDPRENDPIAIQKSNKITKKIRFKPFTLGTHHQIWDDSEFQAKLRHWRDDNLEYAKDHKMLKANNLFEEFISKTSEESKEQKYSKEELMKDVKKINLELRKANSKFSVQAKKIPATGELYDLGTMLAYDTLLLQKKDNKILEEEFQELVAEIHSPERYQRKKKFSELTPEIGEGEDQTTRRSKRPRKEVCYTDDFSFSFEDEISV